MSDSSCASFWPLFCSQSLANASSCAPASALTGFVTGEGIWLPSCSGDWDPECDEVGCGLPRAIKLFSSPFSFPLFFFFLFPCVSVLNGLLLVND